MNSFAHSILQNKKYGIFAVILLSAALRMFQLGTESLWVDEGYSLRDASAGLSLTDMRPLYFIILHFWAMLGGSDLWLRLPAAIFGILSVWLMYVTANRLAGHRVGIVAALFMAVSILQINHSQEVRMYSLVTLFTLAEALFFIQFIETGRARNLVLTLIFAGLAFLAHPLTVLMLAVFNTFFLLNLKRDARRSAIWFTGQALIAMPAVPYLPKLLCLCREFGGAWVFGMAKPGVLDLLRVSRDFFLWQIPLKYGTAALLGDIWAFFMLCLAAYGTAALSRRFRWQAMLAVLWLIVPLAGTMLISHAVVNVWMVRYLIYASPALYILTAMGTVSLGRRNLLVIALACVLSLPAARLGIYYTKAQRPEWRQAVSYIESNLQPGDAVAVYRYGYRYVFNHYYTAGAPVFMLGSHELGRHAVSGWTDSRIACQMAQIPQRNCRIWFILSEGENIGEAAFESYIKRKYRVIEYNADYYRVRIYLVTQR